MGAQLGLLDHSADLEDPRLPYGRLELVWAAIGATGSGAGNLVAKVTWERAKVVWLWRFLTFENDVAYHATFALVFVLLNSAVLDHCFLGLDGCALWHVRKVADRLGRQTTLGQIKTAEKHKESRRPPNFWMRSC